MTEEQRQKFDSLVEEVIDALPPRIADLLNEVPVVVLDEPEPPMLKDLGIDPGDDEALDEICGLHTGVMLTERSVEDGAPLPTVIHLFRRGIVCLAGGWDEPDGEDAIYEEIRTTLLHEIGHHFGLEEDDLADLGYD